jgi:hypothetical protein
MEKIAYRRQLSDQVAIFVYSIDNESVEQYSFPKSGEKDLLMSWSQDNNRLAFVRSAELSAQLLITDNSQQENIIIDNEKMILGLAWDNKNDDIYFNVMRDADFSIEKYDVKKNSVEEFHRDTGIYGLGISEASSNTQERNSNYGMVFSFWDKLFSSYTEPKKMRMILSLGLNISVLTQIKNL